MRAFILAAGEGTRLRPLTEKIPKPLIPIFHKPLLTFALDHFLSLGIQEIGINTRYLWEKFYQAFSVPRERPSSNGENTFLAEGNYSGHPLHFFREPVPIDSGGALRNARSFLEKEPFLLHNGDTLSTVPLTDLIQHHRNSGSMATLLLREEGRLKNVGYDAAKNEITSIRGIIPSSTQSNGVFSKLASADEVQSLSGAQQKNLLNALDAASAGAARQRPTEVESQKNSQMFFYPGIAVVEPALLDFIEPSGPASLIDALLAAMQAGHKVAGFVSRVGFAIDIGTEKDYLTIHRDLQQHAWKFPFPFCDPTDSSWPKPIHPTSIIDSSAELHDTLVVGPHARVGARAKLTNCILLPGTVVKPDALFSEAVLV